jgi:hypothetical protein
MKKASTDYADAVTGCTGRDQLIRPEIGITPTSA